MPRWVKDRDSRNQRTNRVIKHVVSVFPVEIAAFWGVISDSQMISSFEVNWLFITRRRQISKNVEPLRTWAPCNPVATKNVFPYTLSEILNHASKINIHNRNHKILNCATMKWVKDRDSNLGQTQRVIKQCVFINRMIWQENQRVVQETQLFVWYSVLYGIWTSEDSHISKIWFCFFQLSLPTFKVGFPCK